MPQYIVDESGPLELGYFYKIWVMPSICDWPRSNQDGWIFSDRRENEYEYCLVESVKITKRAGNKCPIDPDHSTGTLGAEIEITVDRAPPLPMIPHESPTVLINSQLNTRLKESKLIGTDTVKASVSIRQGEVGTPPEIYVPVFPGACPFRKRIFVPASKNANSCGYCGHGPVFCPECQHQHFAKCPKCGEQAVSRGRRQRFPKTIYIAKVPPAGPIVDASLWDGSDFNRGLVVTRRAIEFLLSVHALPFRAQPLRAYVGTCSKDQRRKLEEAKRLVM